MDVTVHPLQQVALHLLGFRLRDHRDELDEARQHEGEKRAHLRRRQGPPSHDDRLDLLAKDRVRDADDRRVLDVGMTEQGRFDLGRQDVLAAAPDDFEAASKAARAIPMLIAPASVRKRANTVTAGRTPLSLMPIR